MKPMLLTFFFAALFLLAGSRAFAQTERQPRWVPVKGYWVVESNIHQPNRSTVYFYNNSHELVYEELIERTINLDRQRTLVRLNRVLETAVANHEKRTASAAGLLAVQFNR